MTNPDNIVRVRARNGGRASVYEANGWAQAYTGGLFEGNGVIQNTSADMNVLVGGSAAKPDVVLAENPAGYKFALDIVGQQAVAVTAPASNSRISAIVAYTDDLSLATTEDTVTGSPASCGLIVVNGTAAADPTEPSDAQIRSAITADGATGSQAAYCVIATILVENTTTIITNSLITIKNAQIGTPNIDFTTFSNLPVVTTTGTLFVISSTNITARYTRVGNVVFAFVNITCPSISAHDGTTVSTGGVPDGYKPAGRAMMSGGAVSGGSTTGNFSITIDPDNTRTLYNGFTTSNSTRLQLIGTWVTNDTWPTS